MHLRITNRKISLLLLASAVGIALVMMVANHVMLRQIHEEAVRQANRQQESSMLAFWEQIGRRGRTFRIEDGNLRIGDHYILNDNNEIPDRIFSITGSRATVFLGDTRIATNIIRPDGSRRSARRPSGSTASGGTRASSRCVGIAGQLINPKLKDKLA